MHTRHAALPLALLLSAAPLAACGPDGPSIASDALSAGAAGGTTVMTRNLYVGADLFAPFASDDPLGTAAAVWQQIQDSDPGERMAAVADEIARAAPDLVALQEAYRFEVTPLGAPGPLLLEIDYLDSIEQALAARSLAYQRAAVQPHTVLTVPFPSLGVQVTIIDRDAILADEDVTVLASGGGDFDAAFTTSLAGVIPVVLKRGWAEVQAEHEGVEFTFVSTHLETKDFGPLQSLQALELVARFGATSPLVLAGDTNSDPGDPAPAIAPGQTVPTPYAALTSVLEDAWRSSSVEGSYTCCFDADIAPPSRPLFERVDLVLLEGAATTRAPHRVGLAPLAELGGRYPSDHAGVVARLRFEAVAELAAR
jgi:endonuclease/exonuclease/phosphatase family metal-dependent hydrolase